MKTCSVCGNKNKNIILEGGGGGSAGGGGSGWI